MLSREEFQDLATKGKKIAEEAEIFLRGQRNRREANKRQAGHSQRIHNQRTAIRQR